MFVLNLALYVKPGTRIKGITQAIVLPGASTWYECSIHRTVLVCELHCVSGRNPIGQPSLICLPVPSYDIPNQIAAVGVTVVIDSVPIIQVSHVAFSIYARPSRRFGRRGFDMRSE